MNRQAAATDFFVDVEGVGRFSFAQRRMRDELAIGAEFSRITEGVELLAPDFDMMARWVSVLSVLTVSAPPGWDIYAMDPLEQESYDKLRDVFNALRFKELDFRKKSEKVGAPAGAAGGEGAGVLVSQAVQPGADGSALS